MKLNQPLILMVSELLSKTSLLEKLLNRFSFERLTLEQVATLKPVFKKFALQLAELFTDFSNIKETIVSAVAPENQEIILYSAHDLLDIKLTQDYQTSLSEIIRFIDLMKKDFLTQRQMEPLDEIKSAAHALLEIINDVLLKPNSPDELLLKSNTIKKIKISESNDANFEIISLKSKEAEEFSLNSIYEDCMEQMELLEEFIRLFKKNILEFIGEVRCHLAQRDFDKLEFSLHKIKSGLTMMQTGELLSMVKQMQNCSKTDRDLKHLNFLYTNFLNEYSSVQAKIDSELRRLQK